MEFGSASQRRAEWKKRDRVYLDIWAPFFNHGNGDAAVPAHPCYLKLLIVLTPNEDTEEEQNLLDCLTLDPFCSEPPQLTSVSPVKNFVIPFVSLFNVCIAAHKASYT